MARVEHPVAGSYRLIGWMPVAVALCLIVSMMSDKDAWLYVAALIGVLASVAVGRTSATSAGFVLQTGMRIFARSWAVVVALAALSGLHENWQPMFFFAVVGVVSSALFWLGCRLSRRSNGRSSGRR